MSTPNETAQTKLRGLCLSYHHTDPRAVGSRRFRILRDLLGQQGIDLDILAFDNNGEQPEERVFTAGSSAPVKSILKSVSNLKHTLFGESTSRNNTTSSRDFAELEKTRTPEATLRTGLRSFIRSYELSPDAQFGWIGPVVRRGQTLDGPYDFVISTAPPWSSHIAAMKLAEHFKCPVILDDRDPWVGSPARWTLITHPWFRRRDERVARRCYEHAAAIVCVTQSACDLHRETWPDMTTPVACLRNAYNPSLEDIARPSKESDKIRIGYVGSFYHGRSPRIVLNTAAALPKDVQSDFEFHFVGGMNDEEKAAVEAIDCSFDVVLHGHQSHDYCLDLLLDSDVCLLLAIGQPRQIPAKVYEYIGLGRPVLSISTSNDATMNLLADRDWAWTVPSDDPEALVQTLKEIHRAWSQQRLPRTIPEQERQEFSFEAVADRYAAFIRATVAGTVTRGSTVAVS